MTAIEYIAGAFVLVAASFLFIDIAFRIERKLDSKSVFDFFDALRLLFFALGFVFMLLALNFGRAIVAGTVTDMTNLFDRTIVTYTLASVLVVVFGAAYIFISVPRMLKKTLEEGDQQQQDRENRGEDT